jgi:hypothetical protein
VKVAGFAASLAPSVPWLAAVDTLISALKTAGVWANLDQTTLIRIG